MPEHEPVVVEKPKPPQTFLGVANSLMVGVRLMVNEKSPGLALPLVAGHLVEIALKAYPSRAGKLKKKFRTYEIKYLWKQCVKQGLRLGPMPDWAADLSEIHGPPFHLSTRSRFMGS